MVVCNPLKWAQSRHSMLRVLPVSLLCSIDQPCCRTPESPAHPLGIHPWSWASRGLHTLDRGRLQGQSSAQLVVKGTRRAWGEQAD